MLPRAERHSKIVKSDEHIHQSEWKVKQGSRETLQLKKVLPGSYGLSTFTVTMQIQIHIYMHIFRPSTIHTEMPLTQKQISGRRQLASHPSTPSRGKSIEEATKERGEKLKEE
mmetsp:Transcript_13240/g.26126  ORF Transcript_13240/g.26126 Transcript_13240/m.26126 type:complete len:113 (+) Transcript_13240:361-699(+)